MMENATTGVMLIALLFGSLWALRCDRGWIAAFLMTIGIAMLVHTIRDGPGDLLVQDGQQHTAHPSG